jgi:hypothetical protein
VIYIVNRESRRYRARKRSLIGIQSRVWNRVFVVRVVKVFDASRVAKVMYVGRV